LSRKKKVGPDTYPRPLVSLEDAIEAQHVLVLLAGNS
jgi:hypothetical protein